MARAKEYLRAKFLSTIRETHLAPVAFVFNERLESLSLFKMSLLKLLDPCTERDSLAECIEKAHALGVLAISILRVTAFLRVEFTRAEAATRTPHGCAIDCIACSLSFYVRRKQEFSRL